MDSKASTTAKSTVTTSAPTSNAASNVFLPVPGDKPSVSDVFLALVTGYAARSGDPNTSKIKSLWTKAKMVVNEIE